jgi:transcriptional regulator CtsR
VRVILIHKGQIKSEKGLVVMAILSNDIEIYIKSRFDSGFAELKRSELAELFQCAPSQINYVLTTRFPVEKGYVVTSRRGGGGGIRIRKINLGEKEVLYRMIKDVLKDEISGRQAQAIIEGLVEAGILSLPQGKMAAAAVSDRALTLVRDGQASLRADILKQILVAVLYEE